MRDQFCWQPAYRLASEAALEDRIRPPREVERHLRAGFVHRQQEPVARDTTFVTQRLAQRFTESDRAILDGVVLVDLQVAFALELELEPTVLAQLFEHMVEEADRR